MHKSHVLMTHRTMFLEQPWLDEEILLLTMAIGLLLGMGAS